MINSLQMLAQLQPKKTAIQTTQGEKISYAALWEHVNYFPNYCSNINLETIARVAIVMTNNFLLSKNIIAAMHHFVAAPINSRLTQAEFINHFHTLQIDVLMTSDEISCPEALAAAKSMKMPIIFITNEKPQDNNGNSILSLNKPSGLLLSTSGTTAAPKQVFLPESDILAAAENIVSTLELTPEDTAFNLMPLFHIHGLMTGLLAPIYSGGSTLLFNQFNTADFLTGFDYHEPTWITATPSIYSSIIRRAKYCRYFSQNKKLRFIRSSSESLSNVLHNELKEIFSAPVIQVYGITEACFPISSQKIDGSSSLGSVGFPVNTEVQLLNGEIIIRNTVHKDWFHTGDLGYITEEGELFITGRIKEIINKSGEKISPYEIEAIIAQLPAVNEVVCFPIKDEHFGEKIGVAIVLNDGFKTTSVAIQDYVSLFLAYYKIPDNIFFVEAIPKSDSGKLQRNSLEFFFYNTFKPSVSVIENVDVLEKILKMAEEVFKLSSIAKNASFFDLGGDSILGMQLIARMNDFFDINLNIRELYENPVFSALAHMIAQNKQAETAQLPALKPLVNRPEYSLLSSVQTSVWFMCHLSNTESLYHCVWSYRLQGDLSVDALQWSIEQVVRRHESLRMRIKSADDNQYQYLATDKVALMVMSFSDKESVQKKIESLFKIPFNLNGGILFQPYLFQINQQENIVCFHLHHVIGDLWSKQLLHKELSFYYNAYLENKNLTAHVLPVTYTDYVYWLNEWQTESWLETEMAFWKNYLKDAPSLLALPTDYPRPQEINYSCAKESVELSEELVSKLRQFSTEQHMSLYMVLLTVFKVLLQYYTNERKIVIGTVVANRLTPALENIFGFFANTLVLATDLPKTSHWKEAFSLVKESTLQAFQHSFCPFETLVKEINPDRHVNYHPVFQVMFNLVSVPQNSLELSGLSSTEIPITHLMSTFDLHFSLHPVPNKGMKCSLYYNTALFKPETIQRWVKHYEKLLLLAIHSLTTPISKSDFLLDDEKDLLFNQWNNTHQDYPRDKTAIEEFEKIVEESPNNIALICGHQEITYAELNAKANVIAKILLYHGADSCDFIAIAMERSIDRIAGLLGIWKAGAGYVPLNLEDPENRLKHVLQETQCTLLLTTQQYQEQIIALNFSGKIVLIDDHACAPNICLPKILPENIAYVLYTSGSTGKPKGIVVEHRSLWEYLWACRRWAKLQENDRFLQLAPYTFDASLFDFYLPLLTKVTAVLPEKPNNYDLPYLANLICEKKINYIKSVPSFLRLLSDELKKTPHHHIKNIYSVGEELLPSDVQRLHNNTGARICNQYGPTESIGTVSHAYCVPEEKIVTLGHPLSNIRLYVLNSELQPVPIGCYGELYITKHYLAKEYLGQKELTAQCFIPNPFLKPEEEQAGHYLRLYKSGDKVRWLPDGRLQFAGRMDFQIKINGHRIEPGEIETVIATHKAIKTAAVIKNAEQQLMVFLVLNQDIDVKTLRLYTEKYLPAFMVPTHWVVLESLPTTSTGKVNRKLLSSFINTMPVKETDSNPFDSIAEESSYLYECLSNLLKKQLSHHVTLDPHKKFFEMGMNSLRLIQFNQTLRKQLGIHLNIQKFFHYPTLSQLTHYILTSFQENKAILFQPTTEKFLVSFQKEGSESPLFIIPGGWGGENEILPFMLLSSSLNLNRPIYGIRSRAMDSQWKMPKTTEEQAQAIFEEIKKIQPHGPYHFLGECLGGTMALTLAKIGEKRGGASGIVILLDSPPFFREKLPFFRYLNQFFFCKKEKRKREQRFLEWNSPPCVMEYHHMLISCKLARLNSQLHLILSSDITASKKILKRWRTLFKKQPCLYQVKGSHDSYIRHQSAETADIINGIFGGK